MPKPELEFFPVDDLPWVPVEGAPPGHYQKILTEDPEIGFVTRFSRWTPAGRARRPSSTTSGKRCTSWKGVSGMETGFSRRGCMPAVPRE